MLCFNSLFVGVTSNILRIENFAVEDAGTYKCYVAHHLPVSGKCGISYSVGEMYLNVFCNSTFISFSAPDCDSSSRTLLKGVFSKGFDINVVSGSLKVVEEPSDCLDAVIGSSATFACLGESQGGPVTYQWMHNDKLLLGEIITFPVVATKGMLSIKVIFFQARMKIV